MLDVEGACDVLLPQPARSWAGAATSVWATKLPDAGVGAGRAAHEWPATGVETRAAFFEEAGWVTARFGVAVEGAVMRCDGRPAAGQISMGDDRMPFARDVERHPHGGDAQGGGPGREPVQAAHAGAIVSVPGCAEHGGAVGQPNRAGPRLQGHERQPEPHQRMRGRPGARRETGRESVRVHDGSQARSCSQTSEGDSPRGKTSADRAAHRIALVTAPEEFGQTAAHGREAHQDDLPEASEQTRLHQGRARAPDDQGGRVRSRPGDRCPARTRRRCGRAGSRSRRAAGHSPQLPLRGGACL